MPYPILVSALGAIVASLIAMFGLHSWSAMKIAPVVGAILGLAFAMASLRRYGLSFDATLEEYRAAAGVRSLKDISLRYMNIALGVAIVVSIIELPAILFGQTAALFICSSGWIVIFGFTLHRAWQITDPGSFGRFDIFQVVSGAALLMGLGAILCGFVVVEPTRTIPAFELVRVIFVLNACAAMEAMAVAIFALNILCRVLGMMNPR